MGLCLSSKPTNTISAHVLIIHGNKKSFKLSELDGNGIFVNDFLIRTSGYLVVGLEESDFESFAWTKKFVANSVTKGSSIIEFNLININQNLKKVIPFVRNDSFRPNFRNSLWQILNLNEKPGLKKEYPSPNGSVFRIGEQIFTVKLFSTTKTVFIDYSYSNLSILKVAQCHLCGTQETSTNRIVHPCSCVGAKVYHSSCLSNWVRSRCLVTKEEFITRYDYSRIRCSECLKQFSTSVKVDLDEFPIVDWDIGNRHPFAMLDVIDPLDQETITEVLMLNYTNKNEFHIGSSSSNDLVFGHESVFSEHASLKIIKKQLFFVEKGSSAESLQMLCKDVKLNNEDYLMLKVGKIFIEIHPIISRNCSCFDQDLDFQEEPFRKVKEFILSDSSPIHELVESRGPNFFLESNIEESGSIDQDPIEKESLQNTITLRQVQTVNMKHGKSFCVSRDPNPAHTTLQRHSMLMFGERTQLPGVRNSMLAFFHKKIASQVNNVEREYSSQESVEENHIS